MRNTSVVKRDLYYSNVNLFGSQEVSDRIILQLYRSLFVGPTSLPIIPSAKGLVVGPVTWNLPDGSRVSAHERATLIPHEGVPSTTASCVILLEKESIFHLLTSSMLISMLNCLIVTGKGYPDVATRIFLQQLQMLHSLPILTLYVQSFVIILPSPLISCCNSKMGIADHFFQLLTFLSSHSVPTHLGSLQY